MLTTLEMSTKDYFSFSKSERRGIFTLLLILVGILLFNFSIPYLKKQEATDFSVFIREVEEFEKSIIENQSENNYFTNSRKTFETKSKLNPFPFDPNGLTSEQWKKIGLSDKQIAIIKNYEAKGGKFYKKEDLKRIYGISAQEYSILEPFIEIKTKSFEKTFQKFENPSKKMSFIFNLNTADSIDLIKVQGIGGVFAKRIIELRKKLGGFTTTDQLLEVYGMDTARFQEIKNYFEVDTTGIKRISINKLTFQELRKHPYIDYNLSFEINNYRLMKGNFKAAEELYSLKNINSDQIKKLIPYLSFEN